MKKTFFPIVTLLLIFSAVILIYAAPPNSFDIISPKDLVELNIKTVMFQYEDKDDPDGDTLTYHIWIRNYKNDYYSGPFGNTTSNTFLTVLQDDNMKYSWYVIAEDTIGETTTSTNTGTFAINTIEETPHSFNLLSPDDDSKHETGTIIVEWEKTTDPDPLDTIAYTVNYSTDDWNSKVTVTDILENTMPISILRDNIHCDWYVVATDSKGNTNTSNDTFTFSTYPFALVYPLSYEIISSTNVTFQWKLSTDTSSATYEIRIVNKTDDHHLEPIDAGYANTFTKVLNDNTAYMWEAYECNTIDHTVTRSRNTTQSFCVNIENESPTNFNLLLPVDNKILDVTTPSFSWTPSTDNDPWENPIYTLEIAPYGDFSSSIVFPPTDQTIYTLPSELKNFTDYEWRVYASDGNSITYSIETFHFRTSVKVADLSSVNVYPNPASNTSKIHFTGLSNHTSITLYNIAGNVAFELPYWYKPEYVLMLNDTDLKSGIYIYVIKDDKNNKKVGKFAVIK